MCRKRTRKKNDFSHHIRRFVQFLVVEKSEVYIVANYFSNVSGTIYLYVYVFALHRKKRLEREKEKARTVHLYISCESFFLEVGTCSICTQFLRHIYIVYMFGIDVVYIWNMYAKSYRENFEEYYYATIVYPHAKNLFAGLYNAK